MGNFPFGEDDPEQVSHIDWNPFPNFNKTKQQLHLEEALEKDPCSVEALYAYGKSLSNHKETLSLKIVNKNFHLLGCRCTSQLIILTRDSKDFELW